MSDRHLSAFLSQWAKLYAKSPAAAHCVASQLERAIEHADSFFDEDSSYRDEVLMATAPAVDWWEGERT